MTRRVRIIAMLTVCVATIPWNGAQADNTPRPPTPEQVRLCRLEIDAVSEKCKYKGDDAEIVERCSRREEGDSKCPSCDVLLRCLESVSDDPDPRIYGAWEQVIPNDNGSAIHGSIGMPTMHAVLLPSGRILLAGGSGWRNPDDSETYPEKQYPKDGDGVFFRPQTSEGKWDRDKDPFLKKKQDMYYRLVNNVAVYDPTHNTFFRVPPPPLKTNEETPDAFYPNDLFCSGHLHLPDGNPLFMGGTQYYTPLITGVRTSYIFDWKEELRTNWVDVDWRSLPPVTSPWVFSGLMERGRWYPTPVPLQDGRFVILSGLRGYDEKPEEDDQPYLFEVNHLVELFDPTKFSADDPQRAWTSIDVKELANSPFQQKQDEPVGLGICLDAEDRRAQGLVSLPCHPEGAPDDRAARDFRYDAFKLYPHVYNFGRNAHGNERLFFTREGDYISMRSPDMATMRNVKLTYWMNVGGDRDNPQITFDLGAPRTDYVPSYGTSFVDPNTGDIRVLGGGKNSPGTIFPLTGDWKKRTRFVGARGSRDMETYDSGAGEWSRAEDFLGQHPQDDRILSSAILLPTQQVLIINGGNYQLQKPIYHPLLLTPRHESDQLEGYKVERMSEAVQPRQYHAVALLLPDGRVWTSGGNTAPAMVNTNEADWRKWEASKKPANGQPKHNPDFVDLGVYYYREGRYARGEKGSLVLPTENWTAEIFSPPYLFIDGQRRAEIEDIQSDHQVEFTVPSAHDKDTKVYLLKSDREYLTKIVGAPRINEKEDRSGHYRLIKLPSVTHGADFGQRLYELEPLEECTGTEECTGFRTPNAQQANIPPGYYMLFFVDARGKPAHAKMVRFDDKATTPLDPPDRHLAVGAPASVDAG